MATKETEQKLTALIDREQDAIGCPYPIFSALRDESPSISATNSEHGSAQNMKTSWKYCMTQTGSLR